MIEKRTPGGESRWEACLPSKGLIQAARLTRQIQGAGTFGVRVDQPSVDFPTVLKRLRTVSEVTSAAHSEESLRSRGIDVFHGTARFDAYDTVLLDGVKRIEGHRFVIATGSRPSLPRIPGLEAAGCLDTTTLWSLDHVPASLIVIGGGPIGLEFAQVFARFGSKVTVLTDQDQVLPREDREVAGTVACMLTGEGITFKRKATIQKVEKRGGQKAVTFEDGDAGGRGEVSAEEILVTAGRLANIEDLNLETLGIHADPEHGIEVDELLQTHSPRVFAIGDVLLRNQYTHAAECEAEVAFQNAVLRRRKKMDYDHLPWATFLDPEVASVGITEAQAREQSLDHRIFRVPYADLDRAQIDGSTEGFAKVVASPSGTILGATILGEQASLVLQQLVLAMDAGIGLGTLADTTQIYPTYARIIHDLADQYRATRLERGLFATALKYYYGFQPRTGAEKAAREEDASNGARDDSHAADHSLGPWAGHGH